jgi:hypothetical protein
MPVFLLLSAALLLCPAPAGSAADSEADPRALWGPRYGAAVAEVERRWGGWRAAFEGYGVPAEEVIATVFPELVRFSGLRNELEVFSLKVLYAREGARYADFSIGPFQMKPSFVERLEAQVLLWERTAPELHDKWRRLLPAPEGASAQEVRRLRVDRLSDIAWQLAYAACFYDAVAGSGLLAGTDRRGRLFLLSAAYNAGFWLDREELFSRASVPRYSPDPLRAGRCHYYEVAAYFAEHDLARIVGSDGRRS